MNEGCPVCISKILIFQLVFATVVTVNIVILTYPVNYNLRPTLKQARENDIFIISSKNELFIITLTVTQEDWEE